MKDLGGISTNLQDAQLSRAPKARAKTRPAHWLAKVVIVSAMIGFSASSPVPAYQPLVAQLSGLSKP